MRARRVKTTGMLGIAAALAMAAGGPAAAQAPRKFGTPAARSISRPSVSPYLNLTQPGIDPAVAYQTLVKPDIQMRKALSNQSQQIGQLQHDVADLQPSVSRAPTQQHRTGHATTFMSTGNYFPSLRTRRK